MRSVGIVLAFEVFGSGFRFRLIWVAFVFVVFA